MDAPCGERRRCRLSTLYEIYADVNIFPEDDFYDSTVTVEPIHTCIRTYLAGQKREFYVPNAFFYADGRFSTAVMEENKLEITVQALSLERYDCFAVSVSKE